MSPIELSWTAKNCCSPYKNILPTFRTFSCRVLAANQVNSLSQKVLGYPGNLMTNLFCLNMYSQILFTRLWGHLSDSLLRIWSVIWTWPNNTNSSFDLFCPYIVLLAFVRYSAMLVDRLRRASYHCQNCIALFDTTWWLAYKWLSLSASLHTSGYFWVHHCPQLLFLLNCNFREMQLIQHGHGQSINGYHCASSPWTCISRCPFPKIVQHPVLPRI